MQNSSYSILEGQNSSYSTLEGQQEQSHVKILKYILGVNRKTTNIAVMFELGRYPIYFSVILAM